jgi:hypothetical protein
MGMLLKKSGSQDGFERSSEMKVYQEPVLDRHGSGPINHLGLLMKVDQACVGQAWERGL